MSGRSPVDSLRGLAPVSDVEAAALFGAAGCEELLAEVTRLPFGRRARSRHAPRRRRRLVLAIAVVALAVTATAATWVVLNRAPARETTSVECVIKGVDTIIPSTSGDPAHDCAVEWRREFGSAPPLVAYANELGSVTVLPRSATPPAGWRTIHSQDVALIELQDSLDDVINGLNSSCLTSTAATKLAETKLAKFGFTGWTVSVRDQQNTNTPGSCTSMEVVDPVARSITLIAGGGLSAGGVSLELADRLRPLTRSCESLPAAVASVRAAAGNLGLSESARTYDLNAVTDNSLRCASIYETVGGTIFLTVRGPSR
jgi:hypothetical protein